MRVELRGTVRAIVGVGSDVPGMLDIYGFATADLLLYAWHTQGQFNGPSVMKTSLDKGWRESKRLGKF